MIRRSLPLLLLVLASCDHPNQATAPRPMDLGPPAPSAHGSCKDVPSRVELDKVLRRVAEQRNAGGFANGHNEWAAVVNREGELCALAVSTEDPAETWPGSQSIAKAKAYTANAFSNSATPMSTARLYTMSQPGHTLYGAGAANPFDPRCLAPPSAVADQPATAICGGTIAFGGGVPLYKGAMRVGGLGLSGDTPCADHEVAKRMRDELKLNPQGGMTADDILYNSIDGATPFAHPLCKNTWRNGKRLGDEPAAAGY